MTRSGLQYDYRVVVLVVVTSGVSMLARAVILIPGYLAWRSHWGAFAGGVMGCGARR